MWNNDENQFLENDELHFHLGYIQRKERHITISLQNHMQKLHAISHHHVHLENIINYHQEIRKLFS